jgi:hypothetical protein
MCSIQWSECSQSNLAFGLVKASVKLGQISLNLEKFTPSHVLRVLKCDWTPLGSSRLSLGCLVLRVDVRENPGSKNRVMTPTRSRSAIVSISPHRASSISALSLRLRSHLADRLRAYLADLLQSLLSGGERDLEKRK